MYYDYAYLLLLVTVVVSIIIVMYTLWSNGLDCCFSYLKDKFQPDTNSMFVTCDIENIPTLTSADDIECLLSDSDDSDDEYDHLLLHHQIISDGEVMSIVPMTTYAMTPTERSRKARARAKQKKKNRTRMNAKNHGISMTVPSSSVSAEKSRQQRENKRKRKQPSDAETNKNQRKSTKKNVSSSRSHISFSIF